MSQYFTLEEANAALETLAPLLRQAVALKSAYAQSETRLQGMAQRVTVAGGSQLNPTEWLQLRARRDAAAARLQELLEQVQSHGCLVKDLEVGLLDFPTLYHGQEVYLCFRLGEDRISYWHGVSEGFRGRKPIDEEFIANHNGGRRQ